MLDLLFDNYAHIVAVVSCVVQDLSANLCKECVVGTQANVLARVNLRAVLTNEDLAALYDLSAVALYAKALCIGISSVFG